MLNALTYKVLSDLWANKTRSILIILSITVGLFAVGVIMASQHILSVEVKKNYARINPSIGTIRTVETFDEDFVDAVRKEKDVADADARHVVTGRIEYAPGMWRDLRIFAVDDYEAMRVNKIFPVSGAWPPKKKEILLERSGLDLVGVKVGDTLTMVMPNDKVVHLHVAGIVHDMIQVPAQFDGSPYAYVSMDTLAYLGETEGYNELAVFPEPGLTKEEAQEVNTRIKDKVEKSGYTIMLSMAAEPGALPLEEVMQAVLLLLGLLGSLSLFLSIFLIINTVSALVIQQIGQIGVMKAVGGRTIQIMGMYLSLVLCYGVMALVLAIPLAIIGAHFLCGFMAEMFNFNVTNAEMPLFVVLIQIAIGLCGPCLAALYPLMTNLQGWAAEAMSGYNKTVVTNRESVLTKATTKFNLWFSKTIDTRPVLMSLRNTMRSKVRLALTLLTLTLAGAIFIGVFNMRAALMFTLEDMLRYYGMDLIVSLSKDYRVEAIQSDLKQMPEVKKVEVWLQFPARRILPDGRETPSIYLFAPQAGSEMVHAPAILEGRWLLPEDEYAIVINSYMAREYPDIEVGDDIVLKINGREREWRVVGVSVGFMASMIYANYPPMAKESGNVGRAQTALVAGEYHTYEYQTRLAKLVETFLKRNGYSVSGVVTVGDERIEMQQSFTILITLLLIMAMLLAVVGGIGLMGTMSINVIERTREIGVLRAIGASNSGVAFVFMREGVLIGLMSWVLGVLASIPLSRMLCVLIGEIMLGTPFTYIFAFDGVWLWLILVIVISLLASFLPARSASRLTIREVLAYE